MNEGCNLLFFVNVNFAVAHSTGRMNKFDFKGYPMQKKSVRDPHKNQTLNPSMSTDADGIHN